MPRRKSEIIEPHLNNAGGDLSKDWYIEFSVRNNRTGELERYRHYKGFNKYDTYEERMEYAEKQITEYEKKIKNGEFSDGQNIEFDDQLLYNRDKRRPKKRVGNKNSFRVLSSKFLTHKSSEVDKKTLQTYRSKLRLFDEFLEGQKKEKDVESIKNEHVIQFLKEKAEKDKLAELTIDKYQQILFSFFKWLIDSEKKPIQNPVMNIPRLGNTVDESAPALSSGYRRILLEEIEKRDPQLWLASCIQYYCAIRPGNEMRLMRLKQINYEARTIIVRNYLAKNSRTEVVDIPDQLYRIIDDFDLESYDQELYVFGQNGEPGPIPLGKNTMRYRFNKIRDDLKLSKEIKFYSWKHSGASELKISGANMYDIQRHLRHKSITTTEKYWRKRLGGTGENVKKNFPDI